MRNKNSYLFYGTVAYEVGALVWKTKGWRFDTSLSHQLVLYMGLPIWTRQISHLPLAIDQLKINWGKGKSGSYDELHNEILL